MRFAPGWRARRCWSGLAAVVVMMVAATGSARASVQEATGRVYTLAAERSLGEATSVAVARDGTIYTVESWTGRLWRLAPRSTRLRRVARADAFSDVATGTAGDVLLSDFTLPRVWRLSPDGVLSVAAGANGDEDRGLGGDGGPASSAQLCSPGAIAALSDGGFIFADGGQAVRRVAADGTISTVAATVTPPMCDPSASSEQVADLASMPDGGFAMVIRPAVGGADRIVRVAPSGVRSTLVASAEDVSSIAVAADGALFATDLEGLMRWPAGGGRRAPVFRSNERSLIGSIFDRDGEPASRYRADLVDGVAVGPDGGIVALRSIDRGARVLYIAPGAPGRMAIALRPHDGRAGAAGYVARYLATRQGAASLAIRDRRGRRVAAARASAVPGRNTIALRRRLPAGVYTLKLVVTGADGQRASDSLKLVLGGRLPLSLSRDTLRPDSFCGSNCELEVTDGPCQRFGPRRLDCRFSVDSTPECRSALLTRHGTVRVRAYTCPPRTRPPFPAHPRYHGPGQEAAPPQTP